MISNARNRYEREGPIFAKATIDDAGSINAGSRGLWAGSKNIF